MKVSSVGLGLVSGIISAAIFLPAVAQVTSDGTTNTTVNTNGNNFTILNGIEKGNNLFHSFSDFSVPTGGSAKFNLVNTPNITTIFSRVTGGNVSNIDGLIQTLNGNNAASLFLMNPNGIVFGENASLNIGGSFVGTTANSIKFSDGTEFSAVNTSEPPLLTMSVPVGLQMGSNPGDIEINNTGHNLSAPFLQPLRRGNASSGLSVKTGNTLALVGGNVSLMGGILNAPDGQVELAAVATPDLVAIDANNLGWRLNYGNISGFGDIQLRQQSLIEASNIGAIRLAGNNLRFFDGSLLLIENQSNQSALGIDIQATGTVEFAGISNTSTRSGVISDVRSSGKGGDISITADTIIGRDYGTGLRSYTFGNGDSGNITLNAASDISFSAGETTGSMTLIPMPLIEIRTRDKGNTGDLTINTERLILQSAFVAIFNNNGSGNLGNLVINATDSVVLESIGSIRGSIIGSGTVSTSGDSGNTIINTPRLIAREGSAILSSTYGGGNAGNITLNVSEFLEMSGSKFDRSTNRVEPTEISTAGVLTSEGFRRAFGLPDQVTGNAGTININTPRFQLTDGALVTVGHDSVGDTGKIQINSDSLRLDTQGQITAATASGEGGNIILNLQDSLMMRNNSLINTESLGTGNGGNITINSPVILGLENSDIIANAFEGNGGNIDITTQGIFGLENRDQLTPENDITASSQFGVNGTVNINNFGTDPSSGLVELPVTTTDPSQQIASGCADTSGSSFIATGRGGIPTNPNQDIKSDRTWSDIRDISAYRQDKPVTAKIPAPANPVIQATSWRRNQQGEVELIAENSSTQVQQSLTCAALPQS